MRQVDEAEIVLQLRFHIRRMSASMRNGLASRHADTREQAAQLLAVDLARKALGRYEVLSGSPVPPGSDLFTRAAFGRGDATGIAIEVED